MRAAVVEHPPADRLKAVRDVLTLENRCAEAASTLRGAEAAGTIVAVGPGCRATPTSTTDFSRIRGSLVGGAS